MTATLSEGLFQGWALEDRIRERAEAVGISLSAADCTSLAYHARAVAGEPELHLTSIRDPEEFLERHLGEAFEGAALLDPALEGLHVDLGSGNGYPAVPLAVARKGLRTLMTEASRSKAAFLERAVQEAKLARVEVLPEQVQRGTDLPGDEPVVVLTCRAMGAWPKIVPRIVPRMTSDGHVLIWCGAELEGIARREAWRRLTAVERRALPQRESSFVWRLRPASH